MKFFELDPIYTARHQIKDEFLQHMVDLTNFHINNSQEYAHLCKSLNFTAPFKSINDLPYVPVSVFKTHRLTSITSEKRFVSLTSSGTTSQKKSIISIDQETAKLQRKSLSRIISSEVGPKRTPLGIIDSQDSIGKTGYFSARGAGIRGFASMASEFIYLLDENEKLNEERLDEFVQKFSTTRLVFFGFTFVIWNSLLKDLQLKDKRFAVSDGVLFHGGGWKKAESEGVSKPEFDSLVHKTLGNVKVVNFYGMAEQTGSIFLECEQGFFHSSIYSDVIVRSAEDFSCQDYGSSGLIQVMSVIQRSYPGHSVLTEDLGTVYGEDDCSCGRGGKYFQVHGRVKGVELRGCSDV